MDIVWQLLLQVVLIALNAVFACAEIAVISISDAKLETMIEDGNKRAIKLARLTKQPARFLATIQVAITSAGFLGSAFAADYFAPVLSGWLLSLGVPLSASALNTICLVLVTIILSYVTLIFGELVPKRLAMKKSDELALGMAGMLSFVAKVFKPLVSLLTASTNGVLRLMGMDPNADDEEVTEEEIQMMVDTGSRKGTINPEESEMIHNVFEFNDLSVNDIATHRRDVTVLWTDDSEEEWNEIIRQTHHTMYPVCSEDIDNIVGVLNVRDYFCLTDHSRENVLKNAVKPAFFIPESVRADVLFRRMKQTRCHFAIVLDEYGGMEGIVTITDLLSEIVGDYDEEEEPEIVKLSDDSWQIRGTTSLEDVEDAIGISFDEEDCDTFGGLILSRKGFIPKDGSQFEMELSGLLIHVTEIQGHRIENTVVQRLPEEAETTAPEI